MAMPEPIGLRHTSYLPEEINIWMYAMVVMGSGFVVFVAISVYLMWRNVRARKADIEREALCESEKIPSPSSLASLQSDTGSCEVPDHILH